MHVSTSTSPTFKTNFLTKEQGNYGTFSIQEFETYGAFCGFKKTTYNNLLIKETHTLTTKSSINKKQIEVLKKASTPQIIYFLNSKDYTNKAEGLVRFFNYLNKKNKKNENKTRGHL